VEERRKAIVRIVGEAVRTAVKAKELVDTVREEVVRAVEEATGIPLTPERAAIMRLYTFSSPPQPSLEELEKLIAERMGLEGVDQIVSYLKSLGGSSSRPLRAGGRGASRGDAEAR
jgi:hypothetical protein